MPRRFISKLAWPVIQYSPIGSAIPQPPRHGNREVLQIDFGKRNATKLNSNEGCNPGGGAVGADGLYLHRLADRLAEYWAREDLPFADRRVQFGIPST